MRDIKRFPRVKNKDGQNRPCLSPFSKSVLEADKKAFVKLMEFVAEADPSGEVVIMAQVENEIGLLDDSRDRSETAEKLFSEKVPGELIDRVKSAAVSEEISGAWVKTARGSPEAGRKFSGRKICSRTRCLWRGITRVLSIPSRRPERPRITFQCM